METFQYHIGNINYSPTNSLLKGKSNALAIEVISYRIFSDPEEGREKFLLSEDGPNYLVRFEQVSRFRVVSEWWATTVGGPPDEPYEAICDFVDRLIDNKFLNDNRQIDIEYSYFVDSDADLKHYQVCGEFLYVDVLSGKPPIIETL